MTIYALFGDDMRAATIPKSFDDYFYIITIVWFSFFSVEIILSWIGKDDYFLKFYFWLDLMATLSMIWDIGWIWNEIVNNQDFTASNAQQASQLARTGRGARVGTRAGRVIRIVRLIRLIRIVKLYKHYRVALVEKKEKSTGIINNGDEISEEAEQHIEENKEAQDEWSVKSKNDRTNNKVIFWPILHMSSSSFWN